MSIVVASRRNRGKGEKKKRAGDKSWWSVTLRGKREGGGTEIQQKATLLKSLLTTSASSKSLEGAHGEEHHLEESDRKRGGRKKKRDDRSVRGPRERKKRLQECRFPGKKRKTGKKRPGQTSRFYHGEREKEGKVLFAAARKWSFMLKLGWARIKKGEERREDIVWARARMLVKSKKKEKRGAPSRNARWQAENVKIEERLRRRASLVFRSRSIVGKEKDVKWALV